MADKRIDQLTAATSLGDSDLLVVEQESAAKKATGTVVSDYINSKFDLTGMASDISTLQTTVAGKQNALTFPLSIAQGGTGATTVGNARVNLGLGTAATANIDNTLTVPGGAADAKATGDAIDTILENIPASVISKTFTTNGVTFTKIDNYNVKITGQSTASGLRFIQLFNGATKVLSSGTAVTLTFPAGIYRFHFGFTGATTSRLNIVKTTVGAGTILVVDGETLTVDVPFAIAIRVPTDTNWGTDEAPTYLYFKAEAITGKEPYILEPTGDTTDRTNEISASIRAFGKCILSKGEFYVNKLTLDGSSTLSGMGKCSIIRLPANSTNYALKLNERGSIENLKLVGSGGDGWIPDVEPNDSDGILINVENDGEADRNRMNISNVEICGFTGAGIKLESTGVNYDNSVNIVNCYIHNNNYGIDVKKNSEYNRIANSSIARNVVGIRMNGGNNLVSNCGINGNTIGILMDTTGISDASNGSHGTFSCCNINHSHTFTSSASTTAIKIVGMGSGEVFSGCQVAYGGIEIQDSIGINFNACNFLSEAPITVSGTGFSMFSCCIFRSTSTSPVTKTGTGVLLFRECYVRTGDAFNPI